MPTKSQSKIIIRNPAWLGPAVSPGEILLEEFLKPLGVKQSEAAKRLRISLNRLNEIVLGKRAITPDTALRLAFLFETSPGFWVRLQADWDLQRALRDGRNPAAARVRRELLSKLGRRFAPLRDRLGEAGEDDSSGGR